MQVEERWISHSTAQQDMGGGREWEDVVPDQGKDRERASNTAEQKSSVSGTVVFDTPHFLLQDLK